MPSDALLLLPRSLAHVNSADLPSQLQLSPLNPPLLPGIFLLLILSF